jgi:MFS family permease
LHFLNDGFQTALLLLLPLAGARVGVGLAEIGLFSAAHFLVGVVVATPVGRWSERVGSRVILTGSLALYGACLCALPLVASAMQLGSLYLVAGIAFGVFHPVAFAELAAASSANDRGQRMATFAAVGDVGRWCVATLAAAALVIFPWQACAPVAGAVILALFAGLVAWNRPGGASTNECRVATNASAPADREGVLTLVRANRRFAVITLIGFLDALANSALYIFVPLVLTEAGIAPAVAAGVVSAFFVASLLGKVLGGALADRLGLAQCLACCQVACGVVLLLASGLSNPIAVGALAVILGGLSKATLPIVLSGTAECLSPATLRLGFGVNQTVLGLAAALSPALLGCAAQRVGLEGVFLVSGAICVSAAVVSTVWMWLVGASGCRRALQPLIGSPEKRRTKTALGTASGRSDTIPNCLTRGRSIPSVRSGGRANDHGVTVSCDSRCLPSYPSFRT